MPEKGGDLLLGEVHPPAIQNQFVFVSVFVLVHIGVVFSLYQSGSSRKEGKICIAVEIGSPFCNYLVEEAVSIKPVDHAADTTMSEPSVRIPPFPSTIAGPANKLIDQKSSQNLCNELGQNFIQGHSHWRMALLEQIGKEAKSEKGSRRSRIHVFPSYRIAGYSVC